MSSEAEERYYRKETVIIELVVTDYGNPNAPLEPDYQEVRIYDPNGNLVTTLKSTTPGDFVTVIAGTYRVSYTLASDAMLGNWLLAWEVEKSDDVSIENIQFNVASESSP